MSSPYVEALVEALGHLSCVTKSYKEDFERLKKDHAVFRYRTKETPFASNTPNILTVDSGRLVEVMFRPVAVPLHRQRDDAEQVSEFKRVIDRVPNEMPAAAVPAAFADGSSTHITLSGSRMLPHIVWDVSAHRPVTPDSMAQCAEVLYKTYRKQYRQDDPANIVPQSSP